MFGLHHNCSRVAHVRPLAKTRNVSGDFRSSSRFRPITTRGYARSFPQLSSNREQPGKNPPLTRPIIRGFTSQLMKGHSNLSFDQQRKIQALESQILGPPEVTIALEKADRAADEQIRRFQNLKQAEIKTNSLMLKTFNAFLKRFDQPDFQEVAVTQKEIKKMNIKTGMLEYPHAVVAYCKGKRPQMEDSHAVLQFEVVVGGQRKTVTLTGVFDGHGGKECAQFVSANMGSVLKHQLEYFGQDGLTDAAVWNALTQTFVQLSKEFHPETAADFNPNAGTTANIVARIDEDLWMANAGDCQAIVVNAKGAILASTETTSLSDAEYRDRVKERFGTIDQSDIIPRINGRLAVGGALGNYWANGAVSARPSIVKVKGDLEGACIVQCSDGIWDVASPDEVAKRFVKLREQGNNLLRSAENLVAAASKQGSLDNITVLISPIALGTKGP